ncbi:hypothetical protein HYV43_07120 [Candidatus Micrarchaeota archaeon]|nr:hypothetical protein [Candidatus Micrarchaeota archaeon]
METEFQFHDFAHLKRTAGKESEAARHNLSDNVHVFLPGATAEQVRRLHDALAKSFNPKEMAVKIPGTRAYQIGKNGSLEYYPPTSEIPEEKQSTWQWVTQSLIGQLKLPQDTPSLIYGGSVRDVKQHAANLMKVVEVIRKLGIEAQVYRNDNEQPMGHHVWRINRPREAPVSKPTSRPKTRRQ